MDDYSVSQTTLEQVFVRFASTQNEETQVETAMEKPLCRKTNTN